VSPLPGSGAAPLVVLATANPHKVIELSRILTAECVEVELASLGDFPGAPDVAETGSTFAENSLLKARAVAAFTGLASVADDSGLCCDALGGMPGVLSARWSGAHGDDASNLRLLLDQLSDVPEERRGAEFRCVAALVLPCGREELSEGTLRGRLVREPRGANGFGYDPIFVPDGDDRTTAEMPPAEKDAISHRGRALRGLVPAIAALPTVRLGTDRRDARVSDVRLTPGDEAPDFTLPDVDGHKVSLSSLRGRRVIVYFYPAAMTPGCTTQACDFRDSDPSLSAAGFAVLGISPDSPAKLAKFRDRDGLTFPLLSDPELTVLKAYGAYGDKMLYGKPSVGVIRSTFVVGADGVIEKAYYGVKAAGHVARLRKDLGIAG